MSEYTDHTLNQYLDQQPGMRQALQTDPTQQMQVEALRQTLAMVDHAMADEGCPDIVRRRVVNRVVWGAPEGFVDVNAWVDMGQRNWDAKAVADELRRLGAE